MGENTWHMISLRLTVLACVLFLIGIEAAAKPDPFGFPGSDANPGQFNWNGFPGSDANPGQFNWNGFPPSGDANPGPWIWNGFPPSRGHANREARMCCPCLPTGTMCLYTCCIG